MTFLKAFIATTILFLLLDYIWLGYIAKNAYIESYGNLLRKIEGADGQVAMDPVFWSAIIVYLLLIGGILILVTPYAHASWLVIFAAGAFFGLVTYGVYNFTAYAVIKDWPLNMAIIDCFWGMFICGVSSLVACYFYRL